MDLTHAFSPTSPVWPGFGQAKFKPALAGRTLPGYIEQGQAFTYEEHGFVATAYDLPTDQYGTQLDPPAHWNPYGATLSDLPPTYAIRPLVVIDIHQKVANEPGYHCTVEDIKAWEAKHGAVPEGAVVMIRSDWYKHWDTGERFNQKPFPGITLEALKFLHLERKILFHGHEPLDTDKKVNWRCWETQQKSYKVRRCETLVKGFYDQPEVESRRGSGVKERMLHIFIDGTDVDRVKALQAAAKTLRFKE